MVSEKRQGKGKALRSVRIKGRPDDRRATVLSEQALANQSGGAQFKQGCLIGSSPALARRMLCRWVLRSHYGAVPELSLPPFWMDIAFQNSCTWREGPLMEETNALLYEIG